MVDFGPSFIVRSKLWTALKTVLAGRALLLEYEEDSNEYRIFAVDGVQVHWTTIWKGTVPDGVIVTYSQATNDADKSDFESNWKTRAGAPLVEYRDAYLSTSNTSFIAARASSYIEDTVAARRSLVSGNSSDTSSGTGARTVKITYYDNSMNGPFTETVTLNGTTAVNTVATNIRFIEKLEVVTAGSGGSNAGAISLKQNTGGGGSTLATINVGENVTFFAHHYVPSGRVCKIQQAYIGCTGNNGRLVARVLNPFASGDVERQVGPQLRVLNNDTTYAPKYESPIVVLGPARFTLYFRSDSNTANTIFCGFGFEEP